SSPRVRGRLRPPTPTSPAPLPTTTSRSEERYGQATGTTHRHPAPEPQGRAGAQAELPLLPAQDRGRRLQGSEPAAALHLREGEDRLATDHRRLPPAPGADRDCGQARARDGAAAVRGRSLMPTQVILLQDVEKVGLRGEVVSVARGFARNYLLPRRLAETATPARVAELERREARRARHAAR